mgnify:CR=1 FL=1
MIYKALEKIRNDKGTLSLALIDPDRKNDQKLLSIIDNINYADFDAILIGGSKIKDDKFEKRVKVIRKNTHLPLILFPGDSSQVSKYADAILFLSLISGRNPKYLIEEHVKASKMIHKSELEVIPTGYLLFSTSSKTTVEKVTKTSPLNMNDLENVESHALAAQYLGNKALFLEAGSNANFSVSPKLVKILSNLLNIPLIVGGGIKDPKTAFNLANAGASYIVTGTLIENTKKFNVLKDINKAVHGN